MVLDVPSGMDSEFVLLSSSEGNNSEDVVVGSSEELASTPMLGGDSVDGKLKLLLVDSSEDVNEADSELVLVGTSDVDTGLGVVASSEKGIDSEVMIGSSEEDNDSEVLISSSEELNPSSVLVGDSVNAKLELPLVASSENVGEADSDLVSVRSSDVTSELVLLGPSADVDSELALVGSTDINSEVVLLGSLVDVKSLLLVVDSSELVLVSSSDGLNLGLLLIDSSEDVESVNILVRSSDIDSELMFVGPSNVDSDRVSVDCIVIVESVLLFMYIFDDVGGLKVGYVNDCFIEDDSSSDRVRRVYERVLRSEKEDEIKTTSNVFEAVLLMYESKFV